MPRLSRKNKAASTAVLRDRKFAEPRAPNTVADAPPPKPEPACAPSTTLQQDQDDHGDRDQHIEDICNDQAT